MDHALIANTVHTTHIHLLHLGLRGLIVPGIALIMKFVLFSTCSVF